MFSIGAVSFRTELFTVLFATKSAMFSSIRINRSKKFGTDLKIDLKEKEMEKNYWPIKEIVASYVWVAKKCTFWKMNFN